MGTINYKSNNFVTIGFNLNCLDSSDFDSYEEETEILNIAIDDSLYYIESAINALDLKIITTKIEYGYYEGFTIDFGIDYNYFDNSIEKSEALKEATKLKRFLLECISYYNCSAVFCGWCTTYLNFEESKKALNAGIKEFKTYIKSIPTYRNFNFDDMFKTNY